MKIGLAGWGIETRSAYRFYGDSHDYVIMNEEPRNDFPSAPNVTVQANTGERAIGVTSNAQDVSYYSGAEACDLIVLSPTAKKSFERAYPKTDPIWSKITTATQIFFENCPTKQIIGVTGTKGKGTTSNLIAQFLEADGKHVFLGGNMGYALLDMIPDITPESWVVIELSSFQLHDFPYSPHIAVHLMLVREHVDDWHGTMQDYIDAKGNIFAHQGPKDIAVYYPKNNHSMQNAHKSSGTLIPYMEPPGAHIQENAIYIDGHMIAPVSSVALRGAHNLQNICAALTAVWNVHHNIQAYAKVIASFAGLDHRLQVVRTLNGVTYVDDSFGTIPNTATVAMDAFTEPKVVITGGHDKGNDMSDMIDRLKHDDIRHIVAIGPLGNTIAQQLSSEKVTYKESANDWTMDEIVATAQKHARPGDIVLLSCGTSSYGIFTDYKDRGNQFIKSVNAL